MTQNQPLTNTQALSQRIESRLDPDSVSQLMISNEAGGINLENMSQVMDLAKMMAIADIAVRKHLRNNPGACLAVAVQAFEWKMSPFAVANKSFVVNDQLAYEAQLIHAVILTRAPIKGRPKHEYSGEGDKRQLKVWAETLDGEVVEYQSPELGKINPKNSPLWKNDPDQQLHYSSMRAWCRRHFPDVILGVYTVDELTDSEPMKDVSQPKPSGLAARLAGATNGFNAASVDAALGETVEQKPTVQAATETAEAKPVDAAQAQTTAETEMVDPEVLRHAFSAALSGEEREAPENLSADQQGYWLAEFDRALAEADKS